jgi:hypothetical protein
MSGSCTSDKFELGREITLPVTGRVTDVHRPFPRFHIMYVHRSRSCTFTGNYFQFVINRTARVWGDRHTYYYRRAV